MKIDGLKLRREIAKQKLTLSEFARRAELSTPAIYQALKNSKPTTETLGKLAAGLGIEDPLELLLPEEQTP